MITGTKLIRAELEVLKKRMNLEPRKYIEVVFGPKQVGKTTLITQFTKRTSLPFHFVSGDGVSSNDSEWISRQWGIARSKLNQETSSEAILIIDEIQKISNWSELVKKEWDADTRNELKLKLILVSTSSPLLQQALAESLNGRFETIYLGHWTFAEMNAAFGYSPEEYVWFGGYPGAAALKQDENQWRNYIRESIIETSISNDIFNSLRIDKPFLLRKLFELGCQSSGQIASFTKMMGQLNDAGNTTTLAHYLQLLDSIGLLCGLNKYNNEKKRQRGSIPKFQVHTNALLSATQFDHFETIYSDPVQWSQWIESCIGTHLLNISFKQKLSLQYWKHVNDEMDYVLSDGKKAIGIEINTSFKRRASGINAFMKTCNPNKVLTISSDGISWQEFIKTDLKTLF